MNPAAAVADPAVGQADTVNILLVDDEPRNLLVLETVLDDPGYRLVGASSGDEALRALMNADFAVLVLDVRMPGMSGFELAQMVKERRRTSHIPIIFLTAYYSEDQHMLAGYDSGAVDYLHKPVNPAVLRSKVAVFADLHRKTRALEAANHLLSAEVAERRRAEARLSELAETLDRRVYERTAALQASEAQLRDADRHKDEFMATLAHELRNPLAPLRNAAHALRGTSPDAARLDWATGVIERQVRSMVRMIDDLMDAGRINRGKLRLRQEMIALETVLQDAVEASRELIEDAGHELQLKLPGPGLLVHADRTRLAQAFVNLLNNAAKYMDRGGHIELVAQAQGDEAVVRVKDLGIGIAREHLERIFEMFGQVESALARSRGGLGIGLALAQRLVQLHHGTIVATSEGLGAGSEFVVRLPLAGLRTAEPPEAQPAAAPAGTGHGLRVLVADDNADAAETTAMLLELLGHTVRRVGDGEAAVATAAEFDPQLVLLDIGMPKLNGFEACMRIRSQPGGAARLIVAVSGWGQPEDQRRSREAGFDRHLVKPVDPAALVELAGAAGGDNARSA
ncbi:MAG: response regulator [Betaproteobacteria bacterium]|nr:response regulator [Betaproteobacteria bacterium]